MAIGDIAQGASDTPVPPTHALARLRRRWSLRVRLPLVTTALVATALGLFVWAAYREVERSALQSGGERALAAAVQIADVLAQSAARGRLEMQRLSADATVHEYLRAPSDALRTSLKQRLTAIAVAGQPPVVLLNESGTRVLEVAAVSANPRPVAAVPLASEVPTHTGVGALQVHNGIVFSDVVVEIREQASEADRKPLGFLVIRRVIQATNTDILNRLLGTEGRIAFGNRTGNIWTNFAAPITAPAIDASRTGITTEPGNRQSAVGGVAVIDGTPWAVWIEFPRAAILASAHTLLGRLAFLALGLTVVAAGAVTAFSRSVTKPLTDLTEASEAIAAGDYARRVIADRKDEVGRLGVAFNTMTDRVAHAHHELEERILQRAARLEERSAELDQFFALSPDMLCIADVEGRFLRVNAAWTEILGWTSEELTAGPYSQFVHPEDVAATTAESGKLSDGQVTLQFENRYRCKDGTYRLLSWRAAPLVSRGLVFAAARDVTERRRVARELEERAVALASVNQELEAFTYSVSHDLRAPLRHITGFATLLDESAASKLDDQERRRLQKITDAANRMGRLIDDLLAFSRMGRSAVVVRRVNLDDVVREARQELSMDPDSQRVAWTVHPLPPVEGEPGMLKQVFVNLVGNALKYSRPRTNPHIEIGVQQKSAEETVVFVRDNGVGFDMQYADKLFGVFQRLHGSDEFEGTGIGLASVRRIVHRYGGRTWAESAVNQGATFYFSLPTSRGAPTA